MAGVARIHWTAPVGMVAALLIGFFFALGHHLFYNSLNNTEAPTGIYHVAGADISRQQLNTAVGTAFAFLVKSCLTGTITIAFVQSFWRAAQASKKGPTLASLDSTYSLLTDIRGLFERKVWLNFQVPLLLAFIAWIVPIASIITPATLSVQSALVLPSSVMKSIPNFDFTSLDFVGPVPEGPDGFCFTGPSQPVQRVAAAVAAQGQILNIPTPASNATWTLDFWAPSLQCSNVEGPERNATFTNILDFWGNASDCSYAYGFLSWTATPNNTLPFIQDVNNTGLTALQSAPITYDAPASIYFATIPQMFNFAFTKSTASTQEKCTFYGSNSLIYTYPIADDLCLPGIPEPECYGQQAWFANSTLLKCDLMNSSYSADFNYLEGFQTVNVKTNQASESKQVSPHQCFLEPEPGSFSAGGADCDGAEAECVFGRTTSKLLSYQGIAYAFNQLLLGSIALGGYGVGQNSDTDKTPGITMNSSIGTTILMDTEELAFVSNFNGVNRTFNNLQMQVTQNDTDSFRGLSNKMPTGQRGDLKSALEMLFQNITISLLAEDYLQPNYSSPYAPPKLTNVTLNRYQNVYSYSRSTLWTAYGLAIFFTLVALGLGVISLLANNASFANNFSTVLRMIRAAPMTEEPRESERDGRQPLPKHLATARIMLGSYPVHFKPEDGSSAGVNEQKTPTAETSLLTRETNPIPSPSLGKVE